MTRKERITHMENLFDKSNEVVRQLRQAIADFQALQPTIDELDNYYKTNWRADFEADEKGKLPADLKRGVLSEDGLWDLLEEYQRLDECIGENEVRPRLTHTPHVNSQKDDARVKLRTMGASWFISYAYYNLYDKSHKNWEKAKTMQPRLSSYNNGAQQYMKTWISMVLDMNNNNLKKNEIGLTPEEIKIMARRLLVEMEKNDCPCLTHTPHVNSQKDDARVKLRTMGASWFISYAYYNLYDKSHRNWEKAKTMQPRLSSYNNGAQQYMKTWISMVLDMNCNKLKKNEIGLTSEDVKRMAQKLLIEMEKNG